MVPPGGTTMLGPSLRRLLLSLLKAPTRAYRWCRTTWSCATLALTLHGITVSAETMRRWVHKVSWVWRCPKLVSKANDPHRVERLARVRYIAEQLKRDETMIFADEFDIHLLPKVGAAWTPRGTQLAIMTPGQHQKYYLAGALDLATGALLHGGASRKTQALFRDLLTRLDECYPADWYTRLYVVVDNYTIHHAKAIAQRLAAHPRFTLLFLPTYCPRADPIERAFGDVHDCCTRNHRRTRLPDLVADVEEHVHLNGPWTYQLSDLYYEPAITAAVKNIAAEEHVKAAA
jgi:DDE superfamily endonuclease